MIVLAIMSGEKRKNKQKAKPKVAKAEKMLTLKQARFAAALMKASTKREAAIIAGYSRKNIDQSANQAYNAILIKAPEAMGQAGLPLSQIIEKHLVPLLHATEVKFAQHKGQFTDFVEVADSAIRLGAVEKAFTLLGAYPAGDPVLAANSTVDVIIADMPRPKYDEEPIDIVPAVRPPRKEITNARAAAQPSSNGAKRDPRPKD
jgi:hypothetical protein